MASTLTTVDFSQLAAPSVVAQVSFETIVAAMLADLQSRDDTFTALVESDPAYKVLEVAAYREMLLRQELNDAVVAVMLAYATGTDLDQIGANYDCARLMITAADSTTIPPTAAVMEGDTAYRARIQLSLEGYSCAGPSGAYLYFAKSAASDVLDASVTSPAAGTVLVSVLSRTGSGAAPQATLDAVSAVLSDEDTRPLCDTVVVQAAEIVTYSVQAVLTVLATADQAALLASAQTACQAYADATHRMGRSVTVAGISAALWVAGVVNAVLQAPGLTADLTTTKTQAPYCTGISLRIGGIGV
jgi:phage-related baseplate assembly protein